MDHLDKILQAHRNGKISIESTSPILDYETLALVYTPGVAQVCRKIQQDPKAAREFTILNNTVAIVTDGTAVLGLGDIGAQAGLPVMEGKAALFKEFAGVNAFPILLDTRDVNEIVETIVNIAPSFGGINLEDIAAPRCFEIQEKLRQKLTIPVFHDDQDGTAVVTLAGIINSLKFVNKSIEGLKIVINGAGAAGTAIFRLLSHYGATNIILLDSHSAISTARKELSVYKQELSQTSNPNNESGPLSKVIKDADIFIGVSVKDVLSVEDVKNMSKDPIIFAMANPDPEINPKLIKDIAAVIATGSSNYPNQINNVLCFPGLFKGLLRHNITDIPFTLLLKTADAIAGRVTKEQLSAGQIIPKVFDKSVVDSIVETVSTFK